MKYYSLVLCAILLAACEESDQALEPLPVDTYTLKIYDKEDKLVYDGGGKELYYYGGNDLALSMPTSKIPLADSLNFMVIFLRFTDFNTIDDAFLYKRYYSLDDDFGFRTESGFFRIEHRDDDTINGSFRFSMESGPDSEYAMRPHPVWGDQITVSGRFHATIK